MLNSKTVDAEEERNHELELEVEEMGLRYVHDDEAGFTRKRRGKNFAYFDHLGKAVTAEKTLARIKSIVIPPAWKDVWICAKANGHLQATGRDARGRKQYRYHPDWTRLRNEAKFDKLLVFGKVLPLLRERLEADLNQPGLPRTKVLAATVQVMELTKIRVGNEIYAQENDSYGLTTMRNDHVSVRGRTVKMKFRGKSGIFHDLTFSDPRLARIIHKCQDLPGEELFGYEDDEGNAHNIGSSDINEYLKEITSEEISAKDFRTWGGSIRALEVLLREGPLLETTKKAAKTRLVSVIKEVAAHLRNTVAVCRKYYIHPAIFESDASGLLHKIRSPRKGRSTHLTRVEHLLIHLLERQLRAAKKTHAIGAKAKA